MVVANITNCISMQPMRSEGGCHVVKGPPFYSCGWEVGVCFFKLCLNFGVESGLSIVHFPLGRLTVGFPFFWVWQVVKPKSSQVSDLFPKELPIAPYFYPICFSKCCPPFIYTSLNPVPTAQVCYFNNVWFML